MDPHRPVQNVNHIILRKLPGPHRREVGTCTEYVSVERQTLPPTGDL